MNIDFPSSWSRFFYIHSHHEIDTQKTHITEDSQKQTNQHLSSNQKPTSAIPWNIAWFDSEIIIS